MTLDMLIANLKTDDKQGNNKRVDGGQPSDKQGNNKHAFAAKMIAAQDGFVNAAWDSFREKLKSLPEGIQVGEAIEKEFKNCCDSAISATMMTAMMMLTA